MVEIGRDSVENKIKISLRRKHLNLSILFELSLTRTKRRQYDNNKCKYGVMVKVGHEMPVCIWDIKFRFEELNKMIG